MPSQLDEHIGKDKSTKDNVERLANSVQVELLVQDINGQFTILEDLVAYKPIL